MLRVLFVAWLKNWRRYSNVCNLKSKTPFVSRAFFFVRRETSSWRENFLLIYSINDYISMDIITAGKSAGVDYVFLYGWINEFFETYEWIHAHFSLRIRFVKLRLQKKKKLCHAKWDELAVEWIFRITRFVVFRSLMRKHG